MTDEKTLRLTVEAYEATIAALGAVHEIALHKADLESQERLVAARAADQQLIEELGTENERLRAQLDEMRGELAAKVLAGIDDEDLVTLFFDIPLGKKIQRIKAVKDKYGLSLKDAKDVVDSYYNRHRLNDMATFANPTEDNQSWEELG